MMRKLMNESLDRWGEVGPADGRELPTADALGLWWRSRAAPVNPQSAAAEKEEAGLRPITPAGAGEVAWKQSFDRPMVSPDDRAITKGTMPAFPEPGVAGADQKERVLRDPEVAAMTGLQMPELAAFAQQEGLMEDDVPLPVDAAPTTLGRVYEERGQGQEGLRRVAGRAEAHTRRLLPPGLMGTVQVHATLDDWLGTDAGRAWTPAEAASLRGAESFDDARTGTRVLLADAVRPLPGESPRAAMERVLRQATAGEGKMDRLLGREGRHAQRFDNLVKNILPEDRATLLADPALAADPRALGLEFLARISHGRPDILQNPRSIPSLMVQTLREGELERSGAGQLVAEARSGASGGRNPAEGMAGMGEERGPGLQETAQATPDSLAKGTGLPTRNQLVERSFDELQREVNRTTGEAWRNYPRTAEQAAANIGAAGGTLTEREVVMLYDMFRQKYPGWKNRPLVEPTPKVKQPGLPSEGPVFRRARGMELLDGANAEFDKALKQYVWAPGRWARENYGGVVKEPPLSFGPDNPWTRKLREKPVYERMRRGENGIGAWAAAKEREGTLDSYVGKKPEAGKRGVTWDDAADDGPLLEPLYDGISYLTGLGLKSTGSTLGDIVIKKVDRGNRRITFEVTVTDELRSGSMTRIPGKVPWLGDTEVLPDNSTGPLFYTLPLEWKWTETVDY